MGRRSGQEKAVRTGQLRDASVLAPQLLAERESGGNLRVPLEPNLATLVWERVEPLADDALRAQDYTVLEQRATDDELNLKTRRCMPSGWIEKERLHRDQLVRQPSLMG